MTQEKGEKAMTQEMPEKIWASSPRKGKENLDDDCFYCGSYLPIHPFVGFGWSAIPFEGGIEYTLSDSFPCTRDEAVKMAKYLLEDIAIEEKDGMMTDYEAELAIVAHRILQ